MIENQKTFLLNRFTRLSRLYASDGVTLKQINHARRYSIQAVAADGDRLQMFFICDGTETQLIMGTNQANNCGIFDLYVNGVLDSNGYDEYSAGGIDMYRSVTLTQPVVKGLNTIELRVNGKNGASASYFISLMGASLQ